MPIDPETGFALADPSQPWPSRVLPRIVVHPTPPDGQPDSAAGESSAGNWTLPGKLADGTDDPGDWVFPNKLADGTDDPGDWVLPKLADGSDDPDDWIVPSDDAAGNPGSNTWGTQAPSAAASLAQPATGFTTDAANPLNLNRPAPRPDPLAAYWATIPASRVGAMASDPPIFPNAPGWSPLPISVPPLVAPPAAANGILAGLANLASPVARAPRAVTYNRLGAPANLASMRAIAFPSTQAAVPISGSSASKAYFGTTGALSAGTAPEQSNDESNSEIASQPSNDRGASDQAPDFETGLTPSQSRSLPEVYGAALSFVDRYLRANYPEIARIPTDIGDMVHDALTNFPEFLRKAEPGLVGLGLSAPSRVAGNVWLLNDTLRGRIAEIVHGRNLPFTFKTIDKWEHGIATSIKTINLNAPSYRNANNLYNTLRRYINLVADFVGDSRGKVTIEEHQIQGRALDVLVPHYGSAAQKTVIKRAIDYGAQQGVRVNIIRHQ